MSRAPDVAWACTVARSGRIDVLVNNGANFYAGYFEELTPQQMGQHISKAALAAGHKVVATGRDIDRVAQAVGESADLLIVKLDITNPADAEAAVRAQAAVKPDHHHFVYRWPHWL